MRNTSSRLRAGPVCGYTNLVAWFDGVGAGVLPKHLRDESMTDQRSHQEERKVDDHWGYPLYFHL